MCSVWLHAKHDLALGFGTLHCCDYLQYCVLASSNIFSSDTSFTVTFDLQVGSIVDAVVQVAEYFSQTVDLE